MGQSCKDEAKAGGSYGWRSPACRPARLPQPPSCHQPGVLLRYQTPGPSYLLITVTFVWVSASPQEVALSKAGTHSPWG